MKDNFRTSVICGKKEKHPINWETSTLGEICRKVKRGASPRPIGDDKWFGGDVGWIRIRDVTGSGKYLEKTEEYLSQKGVENSVRVYPQDLIMSIAGTVGEPTILNMNACIHDGLVCFKELDEDVSTEFVYYYLQRFRNHIESIGMTGTQTNLNSSVVEDIPFLKPSLDEQRRIASVLYSVDKHVEALDQRHSDLQDLKHALMQDLLTGEKRVFQELPVHPHLIDENPAEVTERPPREPCISRIGDYFSLTNGQMPDGVGEEGEYPYINMGYITGDEKQYTDDDSVPFVSSEDTLMIVDGSRSGKVFKGYDGAISSTMSALTPTDSIHPEYLYQLLSNQYELINAATIGSSIPHADKTLVKSLDLFIPPLWEQERIASVLYTVDEMIARTSDLIDEYDRLKRGLMQDLLSGDVRTPDSLTVLDEIQT